MTQTMYLSSLSILGLKGGDEDHKFDSEMTLILGPNGSGKTKILQAIHLLLRGKVFRSTGMSSVTNGKDILKLSEAGKIEIHGEWSNGVRVKRSWRKSGSTAKEHIEQNIHLETTGIKEQQGLLNLYFGNMSEVWEPIEFFNLSSNKMRAKLMMSVQHRPISKVMRMLPEEMPVWARPGSLENPAEPWINSALKETESKIRSEQADIRSLQRRANETPRFVNVKAEAQLYKRLSEIQEELARAASSTKSTKVNFLEGRIAQVKHDIETLTVELSALEIDLEVVKAEAEEKKEFRVSEEITKEQAQIYADLKTIGAVKALIEEQEEAIEEIELSKKEIDELKTFKNELMVAQNKLLITAKKPFEEAISKAVGKPCEISLKNNDCTIKVGGVDMSGLSDGEAIRFIPGVVAALAANIEAKWVPLPLDRLEAISEKERLGFLAAIRELIQSGAISQAFIAGCPDKTTGFEDEKIIWAK